MNCSDAQLQLTAYLDGELADDRGSAVRGHLRSCAACRQVAADEGALRDGLRRLSPVDPPSSLWANVQAQLAAAEVADAEKPSWKRTLSRWSGRLALPQLGRSFVWGGVAAAAVVTFVIWRSQGSQPADAPPPPAPIAIAPVQPPPAPPSLGDVTDDLATEAERITDSYADAAEELLALAVDARARWTPEQREAFDVNVAELRTAVARADEGRPKQKAWRVLIRYLQTAAVRDEVTLASVGAP